MCPNITTRSSHNSSYLPGLVEGDGSLDGALVTHRLQALGPLVNLEHLVDNTVDFDLAGVQVVDSSGELVRLGEAADDGDLVTDCAIISN